MIWLLSCCYKHQNCQRLFQILVVRERPVGNQSGLHTYTDVVSFAITSVLVNFACVSANKIINRGNTMAEEAGADVAQEVVVTYDEQEENQDNQGVQHTGN